MALGPSLLTFLTVFGLFSVAAGAAVRAVALRRSLLFAPAPVPVGGGGPAPSSAPLRPREWRRSLKALVPPRPEVQRESAAPRPEQLPRLRRRRVSADRLLFVACFALYVTIGALLALYYKSYLGDAQSRLANAYYVLFSRDPHLAAIGFVWNPLPSMLLMPLLPFKALWPALTTKAFAANIESALFMSAAVCVLRGIVTDLRVPRLAGWAVVAAFALNPMVLYYGANGMSEALFLLTLVLTTRYLMRWLVDNSVRALALAGLWLGVAYLARNEALVAGAATILLVAGRTFMQTTGATRQRLLGSAADSIIVGVPIATAFAGWNMASFIITGTAFQAVSGNAGQVALFNQTAEFGMSRAAFVALQSAAYAPLLPVIVLITAGRAWRTRDPRPLAAAAVLGSVLVFAVLLFVRAQTYGWLRYTMVVVPLAAVLTGWLLSDRYEAGACRAPRQWAARSRRLTSRLRPALAVGLAGALLGPSLPATAKAMSHPRLNHGDHSQLALVFRGARTRAEGTEVGTVDSVKRIARHLDGLHLANGSVLVDPVTPCISWLVLNSRRPRQFVISNDRDFEAMLADPQTFNARYLMVPPNEGFGVFDAINRTYPKLYEDAGGLAKLSHEFAEPSCPPFRLYRVTDDTASQPGASFPTRGR